jgi:hypothetical protein
MQLAMQTCSFHGTVTAEVGLGVTEAMITTIHQSQTSVHLHTGALLAGLVHNNNTLQLHQGRLCKYKHVAILAAVHARSASSS